MALSGILLSIFKLYFKFYRDNVHFHQLSPLGPLDRVGHRVAMSVCLYVCAMAKHLHPEVKECIASFGPNADQPTMDLERARSAGSVAVVIIVSDK